MTEERSPDTDRDPTEASDRYYQPDEEMPAAKDPRTGEFKFIQPPHFVSTEPLTKSRGNGRRNDLMDLLDDCGRSAPPATTVTTPPPSAVEQPKRPVKESRMTGSSTKSALATTPIPKKRAYTSRAKTTATKTAAAKTTATKTTKAPRARWTKKTAP